MPYEFYKTLHIFGLLLTFSGLAGLISLSLNKSAITPTTRKFLAIIHGVGLLILIVAGFGLAARLKLMGTFPLWIWLKVAIWILIGGISAVIKRKPQWATWLFVVILLLGTCAAGLAIHKPHSL